MTRRRLSARRAAWCAILRLPARSPPRRARRRSRSPGSASSATSSGCSRMSRIEATLRELLRWDTALCLQLNRALRYALLVRALQGVCWLGNGILWYALMLALLLIHGGDAAPPVLHMIFVAAECPAPYQ